MIITGMNHFQSVCKKKLVEWYNKSDKPHKGPNDVQTIDLSNVFIVWSCKTLQNYTESMQSTHTTGINRSCTKMCTERLRTPVIQKNK